MQRDADPAEKQIKELREALSFAREAVIGLMPLEASKILCSYYDCKSKEEVRRWQHELAERLLGLAVPKAAKEMGDHNSTSPRALCPLCGGSAQSLFNSRGFAYPDGLESHFNGSHNARQCDVTKVAIALAKDHVANG